MTIQGNWNRRINRRRFLGIGGMSAAAVLLGAGALSRNEAFAQARVSGYPFKLGVASGDPLPDGVVLWTRLAPDPLAEDGSGGMPPRRFAVRWEVSEDEGFRRIVRRGTAMATPELGHSVHPEVTGLLPGREYFYRFKVGPEVSPVGRTKTAPAVGTALSELSFAFASCQSWTAGYYTAYRHMAAEDLDLVIHLGDYVYEYGINATGGSRNQPVPAQFEDETVTLERYRLQYGLYKSDADLQVAHEAFPWLITLDDHDVENNWADEIPEEGSQTPGREEFLWRRAAAFQAFYEHMPLRRSSMPKGPDMQLYRRLAYGDLAEFNVLDSRQYRDDQPCGDGRQVGCEERLNPSRTILGEEQEQWLLDGLAGSGATWNVLANQVFMMQIDADPGPEQGFSMDTWNGYHASRQRLFSGVAERGVENFIVVTGDAHRSAASDLKLDFDDPDSATVGAEFLGTSISSGGNGADMDELGRTWLAENPHMKFHNAQRGYVRCTLTPEQYRSDYRVLPYVTEPGAPVYTRASTFVEAGMPGIESVEENPVQGDRFSTTFKSETELDEARARRGEASDGRNSRVNRKDATDLRPSSSLFPRGRKQSSERSSVISRRTTWAILAAVLAAALTVIVFSPNVSSAPKAGEAGKGGKDALRMNQIQVIGTHNSYHREISAQEQAEYDELVRKPGDYQEFLAYSHATIPNQLAFQDVRGLELDLFPDPDGGLYAEPLVRKRLGLGPLPDPAWREPGVKVFHISDLDYATTCVRLTTCLDQVKEFSDDNPRHVPILIMLELKQSDPRAVAQGGVVAPPWDAGQLDALDAEIRSIFDESDVITPDDVRRPPLTLEQTVLRRGWPNLDESRGKVAFLLDNEGALNALYAAGRPNLEGRAIFTNSTPGKPDAAFLKRNEPRGANTASIQDLVRKGYLVRTRSDVPLSTVRSEDTVMLKAALASGAHLISTDFPEVGMSARYNSDFVARLPEGGTARCNPVNAPRNCRDDRLERR